MKAIVNALFVVVLAVMMVTASALFTAGYTSVLGKKKADSGKGKSSDSGSGDSGGSDSGSSDNRDDSKGPSTETPKSEPEQTKQPEITTGMGIDERTGKTIVPADNNLNPISPPSNTGGNAGICVVGGGPPCNPAEPPVTHIPDKGCAFHPDSPKCAPDPITGKCPPGFSHNVHDNCFPSGKCPPGFGRHDDDESGRCFPINRPIHCPPGFFPRNGVCTKDIFINIHNVIHNSSSGSHSLSSGCYDAIQIAWLSKVQRGQNHEVDQFIDRCLGVR